MKGVVAALVVVSLVGLGVWLLIMQPPEPEANTPSLSESRSIETSNTVDSDMASDLNKSQSSENNSVEAEALIGPEQRAEQLAEAKAKLDNLILEYNENLTNPELRAETQAQIEKLLKEYNELALPAALAKINEN